MIVPHQVIIVEEAAEILEAQLLACVSSSVKHLIMIGDHFQLSPPVDTYKLKVRHNFGVSLFERLITNGLPHVCLDVQRRMSPSIAGLLHDIYPHLENSNTVMSNQYPICMRQAVWFWDTRDPEEHTGTGCFNPSEAKRVAALAFYLMCQGVEPDKVTILTPYKAQIRRIKEEILRINQSRQMVQMFAHATALNSNPSDANDSLQPKEICRNQHVSTIAGAWDCADKLLAQANQNEPSNLSDITVCSVDNYQGDENDIIIVSTVRSNKEGKIGFLGGPEGRSRRCVLQSRAKCALYIIGNTETLSSPHRNTNTDWNAMISSMNSLNMVGAGLPLQCPRHPDIDYFAAAAKDLPQPGFSFCGELCGAQIECGLAQHTCDLPCHTIGGLHGADRCQRAVEFLCKDNGHRLKRKCCDKSFVKCKATMYFRCSTDASHPKLRRKCCETESSIKCRAQVEFKCPSNHNISRECFESPSAIKCQQEVWFPCPSDASHSKLKRKCFLPEISTQCMSKVEFKCPKNESHTLLRACSESASRVKCEARCNTELPCGHPCPAKCCDPCIESLHCRSCIREAEIHQNRARLEALREHEQKLKDIDEKLSKLEQQEIGLYGEFVLLQKDGNDTEEFEMIAKRTAGYIQIPNVDQEIKSIERCVHLKKYREFLSLQKTMGITMLVQKAFPCSKQTAINAVRLSDVEMRFFPHIKATEDLAACCEFGVYTLILCDVLLGNSLISEPIESLDPAIHNSRIDPHIGTSVLDDAQVTTIGIIVM